MFERVGVHHATADSVGFDVVGRQFNRQVARQGFHGGFADADDHILRQHKLRPQARNADDVPTAAFLHEWHSALRGKEMTAGVDVHRPFPPFRLLLHDRANVAAGGVVDEDIQPVELLLDFVEHGVERIQVAHVGFDGVATHTVGADFFGGFFSGGALTQIVDNDIRPFTGEFEGDGFADAAAPARHQHNFPLETFLRHVHVLLCSGWHLIARLVQP